MDKLLAKLNDDELHGLVQNIKSEHLCLLMIILQENSCQRILKTMSQKAQEMLMNDVKKTQKHLEKLSM